MKDNSLGKILIACGGSAGHIFPAVALIEELRKEGREYQIVIVTSTQRRDSEYLKKVSFFNGVQIKTICSSYFPYKVSLKYVTFASKLIWASLRSFYIILRHRPKVVVGFGGHVSFAPVIIARALGIPSIIHEQNVMPGRANRLLAKLANRIAITFEDTNRFFSETGLGDKVVQTGLPLRKHILKYSSSCIDNSSPDCKKFKILVVGGSRGAHNINLLVLDCLSQMNIKMRDQLHMIHLTGESDFDIVKKKYGTLGVDFQVYAFLKEISMAYAAADILIGRCGANTIFEAASFGLPCILIPHPYGTGHQKENAHYLKRMGCVIVLEEGSFSAQKLEKTIQRLINNKGIREDLSNRVKTLNNPDAGRNLKEQVFSLGRGELNVYK